jgi:hypothetical protein
MKFYFIFKYALVLFSNRVFTFSIVPLVFFEFLKYTDFHLKVIVILNIIYFDISDWLKFQNKKYDF